MHFNKWLTWEYWVILVVVLLIETFGCVWEIRLAIKYKKIKRRMTKRINAEVTNRVDTRYGYTYSFSGLADYKGITFKDEWLEVRARYEIGENVSLLINEYNLKEFWIEGARENQYISAIVVGIAGLFFAVFYVAIVD